MRDETPNERPWSELVATRIDTTQAFPAVTPLFLTSGFESKGEYFYSRQSNPNVAELEQVCALLEGAAQGVAFPTGMAALQSVFSLCRPGDVIVANAIMYGCAFRQLDRAAEQRGLRIEVRDLSGPQGVQALPRETKLVVFETPTNPFLRTIDIAAVRTAVDAQAPGAKVVVDNTWATGAYQRPLQHGAHLVVHSATKYLSGHEDVMGGIVLSDAPELAEAMRAERFYGGAVLDPHAAWLIRRSLQTLELRLERQSASARALRDALEGHDKVEKVYWPEVDGKQLEAYGGILFFELKSEGGFDYATFAAHLKRFRTGTAMAGVNSRVAQPWSGSHASLSDDEKVAMGITPRLVRLCAGVESTRDLVDDVLGALEAT